MSQFERVYKIDRLLRRRVKPSKQAMLAELEISEPTLKRDLEYMRSRLNAPIVYSREINGYAYSGRDETYQLPGLWFSAAEIGSLLLILNLIDQIEPSFLRDQIHPFEERLRSMAGIPLAGYDAIANRIHLIPGQARIVRPDHLDLLIQATLARRRIEIDYFSRGRKTKGVRVVSPARLLYYRAGWYLDAWCHDAQAVRRFAVDAIGRAVVLEEEAHEIDLPAPGASYGIFSGAPLHRARLRFEPHAALWIQTSQWHPDQTLTTANDGSVILEIPYSEPTELLMDILRYGPDVEVLEPATLREFVALALQNAAALYVRKKKGLSSANYSPPQAASG